MKKPFVFVLSIGIFFCPFLLNAVGQESVGEETVLETVEQNASVSSLGDITIDVQNYGFTTRFVQFENIDDQTKNSLRTIDINTAEYFLPFHAVKITADTAAFEAISNLDGFVAFRTSIIDVLGTLAPVGTTTPPHG